MMYSNTRRRPDLISSTGLAGRKLHGNRLDQTSLISGQFSRDREPSSRSEAAQNYSFTTRLRADRLIEGERKREREREGGWRGIGKQADRRREKRR